AAIAAQSSGVQAEEPCASCAAGRGAFATCTRNAAWPLNGACASCGYWGHSKDCSFVPEASKTPAKASSKTPSKKTKQINKLVSDVKEEVQTSQATLQKLEQELSQSKHVNWGNADTEPEAVLEHCQKVVEYFALVKAWEKDIEQRKKELNDAIASINKSPAIISKRFAKSREQQQRDDSQQREDQQSDGSHNHRRRERTRRHRRNDARDERETAMENDELAHKAPATATDDNITENMGQDDNLEASSMHSSAESTIGSDNGSDSSDGESDNSNLFDGRRSLVSRDNHDNDELSAVGSSYRAPINLNLEDSESDL
ncbi:hypothetical protein KEM55_001972, partial [Ascosphaera atra]